MRRLHCGLTLSMLLATGCADGRRTDQDTDTDARGPSAFSRLWVPHFNAGEVRGLAADGLWNDRTGPADVVLTLPAGTHPNALAFDAEGDLWVTDNAGNRLIELSAADLDASGSPVPKVVIDSDGTSLQAPIGLTWDDDGALWVAAGNRLEHFLPGNLDDPGPTTADAVLTASFDITAGLTWDGDGNLWVADASFVAADNAIKAFTPEQLAAAGAQSPMLLVRNPGLALVEGLVFDGDGDLWASSNEGRSVLRLASEDLIVPAAAEVRAVDALGVLASRPGDDTATGRTVQAAGGLALDADGHLFVNSQRGAQQSELSAILRFTHDQLQEVVGTVETEATVLVSRITSNPGFGGLAVQP